jgi:hypothetical protein
MPLADHFTCFWGIRAHHKIHYFRLTENLARNRQSGAPAEV